MTSPDSDQPPAAAPENPFAAPRSDPTPEVRRAFSLGQVVMGTIAGTLLCTACMLRTNHLAFAQERKAAIAFWSLAVCELVLTVITFSIPGYWFTAVEVLASVVLVSAWYASRMQRAYTVYVRTPDRRASNWLVLRVVLFCIIALVALSVAIVEICDHLGIELPE